MDMISEDSEFSDECDKMELSGISSDSESEPVSVTVPDNRKLPLVEAVPNIVTEGEFIRLGKQISVPKPVPVFIPEGKRPKKITQVNKHLPRKKDLLICDRCGKFFQNTNNLMMHQRRHTGVKDYACTSCGLRFVDSNLLKMHERVRHMGERPYVCQFCGMRFCTSTARGQHERVKHIPEAKYECDVCGRKFKTKTDLNKHKFLHTGEKPFRCEMCNMNFARRTTLKYHYDTPRHQKRATSVVDSLQADITDED